MVPIKNLKAFYKKYYRPDNAVLMVTGKFERDKTLALIEKKFAGIKNPNTPLRDNPTIEPPQDGEKRVTLSRVGDLQVLSEVQVKGNTKFLEVFSEGYWYHIGS